MIRTALLLLALGSFALTACTDRLWNELEAGDCVEQESAGGLLREKELTKVDCDDLETSIHVFLVYWKGPAAALDQPTASAELAFCADDPVATLVRNDDEMICYVNAPPTPQT